MPDRKKITEITDPSIAGGQLIMDDPAPASTSSSGLQEITDPSIANGSIELVGKNIDKAKLTEDLAKIESAGGDYSATNGKSSAAGKYQFLWNQYSDDIKRVTGVRTKDQFLDNPVAQEKFFNYHYENNLVPAVERLKAYNKSGYSDSQLAKLVHFKGEAGAQDYLTAGADATRKNNISIPDYIGAPEGNSDQPAPEPYVWDGAGQAPQKVSGVQSYGSVTPTAGAPQVRSVEDTKDAVDNIASDYVKSTPQGGGQMLAEITNPAGDPSKLGEWYQARKKALQTQLGVKSSPDIANLQNGADHLLTLQIVNQHPVQAHDPEQVRQQIDDMTAQEALEIKQALPAQKAMIQIKYDLAKKQALRNQQYDPTMLGLQKAVYMGDDGAKSDLTKYQQGLNINPDHKVAYEQQGYSMMRDAAVYHAGNGNVDVAKTLADKSADAQQKIEKDNPDYFRKQWGNKIGEYVYSKVDNPLYGTIFSRPQLSKDEIAEYGKEAGLSTRQISMIRPEDVPTASSWYGQAAQSLFNTALLKDEKSPGGKFFTGDMPAGQKAMNNWKSVTGEIASGAGMVGGFLADAGVVGAGLKGVKAFGDIAKAAKSYETASNLVPLAVSNYNSAWKRSGELIGDAPEDALKRQVYTAAMGTISTALMSLDPVTALGKEAIGGNATKDLVALLKNSNVEEITTPELKDAIFSTIKKIAKVGGATAEHLNSQVFIMSANQAADNVAAMITDRKHRHGIMDNVAETALTTYASMLVPSLMAGVHSVAAQTPINRDIVSSIGHEPEKYNQAIDAEVTKGTVTPEDAATAKAGIADMAGAVSQVPQHNVDDVPLTDNQRSDYALNLFQEKQLQKKQAQVEASGNDKAQVDPVKQRISELQKQRNDILAKAGQDIETQKPRAKGDMAGETVEDIGKEVHAREVKYRTSLLDKGEELDDFDKQRIAEAKDNPEQVIDREIDGYQGLFDKELALPAKEQDKSDIKYFQKKIKEATGFKERFNQARDRERSVATNPEPESQAPDTKKIPEDLAQSEKEDISLPSDNSNTLSTSKSEQDGTVKNDQGQQEVSTESGQAEGSGPRTEIRSTADSEGGQQQEEDRVLAQSPAEDIKTEPAPKEQASPVEVVKKKRKFVAEPWDVPVSAVVKSPSILEALRKAGKPKEIPEKPSGDQNNFELTVSSKEPIYIARGIMGDKSSFDEKRGGFYGSSKESVEGYGSKTNLGPGHIDERYLKSGAKILNIAHGEPDSYTINDVAVKEFRKITGIKDFDGDITEALWGQPEIVDKLRKAGYDAVRADSMDGMAYYLINVDATTPAEAKTKTAVKPEKKKLNQSKKGWSLTSYLNRKEKVQKETPADMEEYVQQSMLGMNDKKPENKWSLKSLEKHIPTGSEERAALRQYASDHANATPIDVWAADLVRSAGEKYGNQEFSVPEEQDIINMAIDNISRFPRKQQLMEHLEALHADRRQKQHEADMGEGRYERVPAGKDEEGNTVYEYKDKAEEPTDHELAQMYAGVDDSHFEGYSDEGHPVYQHVAGMYDAIDNTELTPKDEQAIIDHYGKYFDEKTGRIDYDAAHGDYQALGELKNNLSSAGKKLIEEILPFNNFEEHSKVVQDLIKRAEAYEKQSREAAGSQRSGKETDTQRQGDTEGRGSPPEPESAGTGKAEIGDKLIKTDAANMDGYYGSEIQADEETVKLPEPGLFISNVWLNDDAKKGIGSGQEIYKKALDEYGVLYSSFPVSDDAMRVQNKLVEKGIATIEHIDVDGHDFRVLRKAGEEKDGDKPKLISPTSPKKVGEAFNAVKDAIGKSELEGILMNWNESRLSEDGDRIIATPGRDAGYSKGKEGGKVRVGKKEFIDWLLSEEPFNEEVYGKGISKNEEWVKSITDARNSLDNVLEREKKTIVAPNDEWSVAPNPESESDIPATEKRLAEIEDSLLKQRASQKLEATLRTKAEKEGDIASANKHNDNWYKKQEKIEHLLEEKEKLSRSVAEENIKQGWKNTADSIRAWGKKATAGSEDMVGSFPGISPKNVGKFIDKVADLVEKIGNIHAAIYKAIEWMKGEHPDEEISAEHIPAIKDAVDWMMPQQVREPVLSIANEEAAKDIVADITSGKMTYTEALDEVLNDPDVPNRSKGAIINYIDWQVKDRNVFNNVTLREPAHQENYLNDYNLLGSDVVTTYISGKTLEDVFGNDVQFDKESKEAQLQDNIVQDTANMVGLAKYHSGSDDVLVYGTDMLGSIGKMPDGSNGESVKKLLAVSGLNNELHAERIRLDAERELATNERIAEIDRRQLQLNKMIGQAEVMYRDITSNASNVLNAARANRIYRNTYFHDLYADKILDEELRGEKERVEASLQKTSVTDKIAEEGAMRGDVSGDKEVKQVIEEKNKSEAGKKVDADITGKQRKAPTEKEKGKGVIGRLIDIVKGKKKEGDERKEVVSKEQAEKKAEEYLKGSTIEDLFEKARKETKKPC